MKVRQLMEELSKQNPEHEVMVYAYNGEDGGILTEVSMNTRAGTHCYFKGDHPFEYLPSEEIGDTLVVLVGV